MRTAIIAMLLASMPLTAAAQPRWRGRPYRNAIHVRLLESTPEIEAAADIAGLPQTVLEAVLSTETRCQSKEGRYANVIGPAQIAWDSTWGALLGAEGWFDIELLHSARYWGIMAAGRVFQRLRQRWKVKSTWRLLCLYSDGTKALGYKKSCRYSQKVLRLAKVMEARRSILEGQQRRSRGTR